MIISTNIKALRGMFRVPARRTRVADGNVVRRRSLSTPLSYSS